MGEIGAWFDSRRGGFFSGIKLTSTDSFATLVIGVTDSFAALVVGMTLVFGCCCLFLSFFLRLPFI